MSESRDEGDNRYRVIQIFPPDGPDREEAEARIVEELYAILEKNENPKRS